MADINYEELDPGIRKTVKWLRESGFDTTDSGDGKSKEGIGVNPDLLDFPHVFIMLDELSTYHPVRLSIMVCKMVGANHVGELEDHNIQIELSYSPITATTILCLFGLDDSMLLHYNNIQENKAKEDRGVELRKAFKILSEATPEEFEDAVVKQAQERKKEEIKMNR